MRLAEALDTKHGDIVAFVGAGGKTSALFRLAEELMGNGWHIVTTTTTRMAASEIEAAPAHLTLQNLTVPLVSHLEQHQHVLLCHSIDEEQQKAQGVPPDWIDTHLSGHPAVAAVLIEADGARGLPLKGAFPHEPAIPASASLVVSVAGLDALGKPLDKTHIYGAENIAQALWMDTGTPVDETMIAAALAHPKLGGKGIPPDARFVPLLNKVTDSTLPTARDIAQRLLSIERVDRVLIGAVQNENAPVREVRRRTGAIILAAGLSTRMGEPKMLLPWGQGSTIIREICRTVITSQVEQVLVITGEWHDRIAEQVRDLGVKLVHNPAYASHEMLTSVKIGLQALGDTVGAALIVLGDQPAIERATIEAICNAHARGSGLIVAPTVDGTRGHPVLFDRRLWDDLLALPDGSAPRALLRTQQDAIHYVAVDSHTILQDLDTPDDYQQARSSSDSEYNNG